ncbi:MAG: septal ring lytic transglycosylase RlpA family protein, partial [Halofilum sp. (in: g-proteobacteria)]
MALAAAAQLAACSGLGGGPADGPGTRVDPDSISPVEPRAEPKSRYGNPKSYVVHGRRYETRDDATGYVAEGVASWYGSKFHGRRTSSGETYDMYALTAAHRSLPLPTYVRVTNLDNGQETVVRVNDRGPFHDERIIDLSYGAALKLGFADSGTARVRVRALSPGGGEASRQPASASGGAEPEPEAGDVFIQVGAFAQLVNAQHLRARVHGLDIRPVEVARGQNTGGERVYRVRVGPLAAGEQARVLSELEGAGLGSAQVLR